MTRRLVAIADRNWTAIDGSLAGSSGLDPLDLPFDRFLNLIYSWVIEGGEDSEIRKFDARLWMPPKGTKPAAQSPWSPEAETASFKSLASALSGGKGARSGGPSPAK